MCVCAASAASFGYQPRQQAQQGARAVATAVVTAPEVVAKTFYNPGQAAIVEPVKSVVYEPVKSTIYDPKAKSAVYVDKDVNAGILRSESEVSANGFNYG